jgi:multidrug resistance efflux pump
MSLVKLEALNKKLEEEEQQHNRQQQQQQKQKQKQQKTTHKGDRKSGLPCNYEKKKKEWKIREQIGNCRYILYSEDRIDRNCC